tara:strand:- start:682 stop:798 length:117 start_codon:yes stop_codon:yes gene_type:complete
MGMRKRRMKLGAIIFGIEAGDLPTETILTMPWISSVGI